MKSARNLALVCLCGTAIPAMARTAGDDPTTFTLIATGASQGKDAKIRYYMPQRLELSDQKPATITKAPEGLEAPLYGVLKMAGREGAVFHLIVDEPAGKPFRLFVDTNGDGDFGNDGAAEWKGREVAGREAGAKFTQYSGGATVDLGTAEKPYKVHLSMYRFDKSDPSRAALKNVLLYYRDYATEGDIRLGDKTFHAMLIDEMATGDFRGAAGEKGSGVQLWIDINGNGTMDKRGEKYDVKAPFNIGGVTYELAEVARDGLSFRVVKSEKRVDEVAMAPDLTRGKIIPAFEAKLMDGKDVKFPGDYKGKVVMLDFWATWCGPCMAEVPNVVANFEKYHDKGFEILGVSLDKEKAEDKIAQVTGEKKMAWPQVYDGLFWKARIAQMYVIESIPAAFLVDGDTGEIVAAGDEIRGKGLEKAIEKALEAKKAKAKG